MVYTLTPALAANGRDRLPIYYVNLDGAPVARLSKVQAAADRQVVWSLELDPGRAEGTRPAPFAKAVHEFRSLSEAAIWLGIFQAT